MTRENPHQGKTVVAAMSFLAIVLLESTAAANCLIPENGKIVALHVAECEAIIAEDNKMVQQHAGELFETWNLGKAYTGALITDKTGITWMYPSPETNPCQRFPVNEVSRSGLILPVAIPADGASVFSVAIGWEI